MSKEPKKPPPHAGEPGPPPHAGVPGPPPHAEGPKPKPEHKPIDLEEDDEDFGDFPRPEPKE
jgi:hypothetical protein